MGVGICLLRCFLRILSVCIKCWMLYDIGVVGKVNECCGWLGWLVWCVLWYW